MNLNHAAVYTEFLNHFLTIIQDEQQKNAATLFSGFLRATSLMDVVSSLNADLTFIPLSAVMKAGLVDNNFHFMVVDSNNQEMTRRVKSVGFFFDHARVQGAIQELGVNRDQFNPIQQLVLVTACQEAKNRVLSGDFKRFAGNVANIEDDDVKAQVLQIIQLLDSMAFGNIKQSILFIHGTIQLSPEAIAIIENRRDESLEMARNNFGTDIPEDQLGKVLCSGSLMLPPNTLIDIYNELIPNLAINLAILSQDQIKKREAKLQLLKLHCVILSLTLHDRWHVKVQWLHQGQHVVVGEHSITLPHSISSILKVIEETVAQKHNANYLVALKEIQEIARNHGHDWFVWSRNMLPLFKSSPAVGEFLDKVLQIDLKVFVTARDALANESAAISEHDMAQTLRFFASSETAESKQSESPSP
jgi:hypothetical protein